MHTYYTDGSIYLPAVPPCLLTLGLLVACHLPPPHQLCSPRCAIAPLCSGEKARRPRASSSSTELDVCQIRGCATQCLWHRNATQLQVSSWVLESWIWRGSAMEDAANYKVSKVRSGAFDSRPALGLKRSLCPMFAMSICVVCVALFGCPDKRQLHTFQLAVDGGLRTTSAASASQRLRAFRAALRDLASTHCWNCGKSWPGMTFVHIAHGSWSSRPKPNPPPPSRREEHFTQIQHLAASDSSAGRRAYALGT